MKISQDVPREVEVNRMVKREKKRDALAKAPGTVARP